MANSAREVAYNLAKFDTEKGGKKTPVKLHYHNSKLNTPNPPNLQKRINTISEVSKPKLRRVHLWLHSSGCKTRLFWLWCPQLLSAHCPMFSITTEYGRWLGKEKAQNAIRIATFLQAKDESYLKPLTHWLNILWMLVLSWELCLCNWEPLKCQMKSDSLAWWQSREQ